MPQFVVIQPNGKYAVFSTVVDNFIYYDASREGLAIVLMEDRMEVIKREIERGLQRGEQTSGRFEECLETIKEVHGKSVADEVRRALSANAAPPTDPQPSEERQNKERT